MGNASDNQSQKFYIPQELLQELGKARNSLIIGIPKERHPEEKRVALTPEAVEILTGLGHRVFIESGAGLGINYSDSHYSEAGAGIVETPQEIFQADLIVKILPPLPEEVMIMRPRCTVLSFLPFKQLQAETFQLMMNKRITALSYEFYRDKTLMHQPIMSAMAEIEGYASISIASELLSNNRGGKGILLGGVAGVSPTEVVIIGAGNAGTNAAKAALALGASVKIFDNNIQRLRKIQQSLGTSLFTSNFHPNVLRNALLNADVVIGALHNDYSSHRVVIAEELIGSMKKGSLIIDLRMNQGGCFETTCCLSPDDPEVFEQYGVLHFCKPFISNYVARTTSMAFSNLLVPLLTEIGDMGNLQRMTQSDPGFKHGIYLYSGKPVNEIVANRFNVRSNNIDIYLTAF